MEPEPVGGEAGEWEAVAALVFDAGDVGLDSGVGAYVAVGFGGGCFVVGPVSPVSVVVGVEEGSLRSGVFGFASDDEPQSLFGPSDGFDVAAEFDHMGTRRGGFPAFGLVAVGFGAGSGDVRAGWGWFGLGKGRCPGWVVGRDVAEGFGDPVRSSSDETEPDVAAAAFGSERGSRRGVGPDPDRVGHQLGVVTRRMPNPHPLRQRRYSRVQDLGKVRNLVRGGVACP